ncbi:MAG: hypothetical protein ACOYLM_13400, partial [Methylococcaceae bacterium]
DESKNETKVIVYDFKKNIVNKYNTYTNQYLEKKGAELLIGRNNDVILICDSDGLEVYDRELSCNSLTLETKCDYYQNVKVDHKNRQIYIIGAHKIDDQHEREEFDLFVLDYDFKLIREYKNIYSFSGDDFWINYDLKYDIENEIMYRGVVG